MTATTRLGLRITIWILLAGLLLVLAASAHAQNVRFNDVAYQVTTLNGQLIVKAAAGAIATVCTETATGTPCAPVASIYPSRTSTTPSTNSFVTADGFGNFGFWTTPGTYVLTITGPNIVAYTYTVSIPHAQDTEIRVLSTITCGTTTNGCIIVPASQPTPTNISISAGNPTGTNQNGGSLFLTGGTPTGTGTGGDVRLQPGPGGKVKLDAGISTASTAIKSQRFGPTCTAASTGATCDTSYTWTTPFADGNYEVTCTLSSTMTGVPTIALVHSHAATGFTLRIASILGSSNTANVDCLAIHN